MVKPGPTQLQGFQSPAVSPSQKGEDVACVACLPPDSWRLRDTGAPSSPFSCPKAVGGRLLCGGERRVFSTGSILLGLTCPHSLKKQERCSPQKPLSRCPSPSPHQLLRPLPCTPLAAPNSHPRHAGTLQPLLQPCSLLPPGPRQTHSPRLCKAQL